MTQPENMLFVISDEHAAMFTGAHGHPIVKTPNIGRLAARGTRFANAYCTSPICMPSRAALATGRYPHQTGYWCNATPYDGRVPSWADRLQGAGVPVSSIGKLHYKTSAVQGGFDRQIVPMHAVEGRGDLLGAMRQKLPLPPRLKSHVVADEIGRGESSYTRYDRQITEEAVRFITEELPRQREPWVLQVGLVAPHFPLIAPDEFFDMYPVDEMPLPRLQHPEEWPRHPWFDEFRKAYITDRFFDDEKRRIAIAAYFGLCSFVDHNLGLILDALDAAGLTGKTRVVYTSDHGDNLGVRGLWQKSNFYEESAAIPMVMAGPGIPEGKVVETPVSLIDVYPTMLDTAGVALAADEADLPGRSLLAIAAEDDDPERVVFGEYHAAGSPSGAFMLRQGRYKYIHYAGYPAQLYDLQADPGETEDLATSPDHRATLDAFEATLRAMLDPMAVDARAKADQAALIDAFGGPEAVLARGTFGATPPPGNTTAFG